MAKPRKALLTGIGGMPKSGARLSPEERRFAAYAESQYAKELEGLIHKWKQAPDDINVKRAISDILTHEVQKGHPQANRELRVLYETLELERAVHKQYAGEINALKSSIEHLENAKAELEKKYGGKPPKWLWKNVKKLIADIKKSGGGWPHTWPKKLFERPKSPQDLQKLIDSLKKELAARQSAFSKKFKA